jgi:hypothetical protein
LQKLYKEHQNLLQSYSRQKEEVLRLNQRIKELTLELELLRSARASETDNINDGHAQDVIHSRESTHKTDRHGDQVDLSTYASPPGTISIGQGNADLAVNKTTPRKHDLLSRAIPGTGGFMELSTSGPDLSLHLPLSFGVGPLDPFQTYPSDFPPTFVSWCNNYC